MTLDPQSKYPGTRSYVLKLHREAPARRESLAGRLEHMASGRHCEFASGEQLLALLAADLDREVVPAAD